MPDPTRPIAKRIVGYSDPLAPSAGSTVTIHISAEDEDGQLRCEIVRLLGPGTPDCEPPYEVVGSISTVPVPARRRAVHPGSAMTVQPGQAPSPAGIPALLCLAHPTCTPRTRQVLMSWGDPWSGDGIALYLDAELRLALTVTGGATQTLVLPEPLRDNAWSAVMAGLQPNGTLTVRAASSLKDERSWTSIDAEVTVTAPQLSDRLVVGGRPTSDGYTAEHYTGLLEAVTVLDAPLEPTLCIGTLLDRNTVPAQCWAAFDFSADINTWSVTDRGPNRVYASLHNVPMRAVPGVHWTGEVNDWRAAPEHYAAVHFLADALEDCGWPADWTVQIPQDAVSGFYAARVSDGRTVDYVPFFVRAHSADARILFVAPTATYAAYANSRFWWEDPIQELVQDRLVELGAEEQYLVVHPELGMSNYDQHLDGTPVCYSSRRRPNLNMRPGHVRGEGYASDLDLVAWLERTGLAYDVVTDEDWHRRGRSLLDDYEVLITGTHPEYASIIMLDSGVSWTADGGRLMYMGGNGFNMNVTFDPQRPWIMENRRVELWEGEQSWCLARAHNSIDGERGGTFPPSGRRPASLIGVESATMGFDRSYPYHLNDACHRPDVAFALEGVAGTVLGARGDRGGVVGQEWDNAAGTDPGPGHVVLGSSRDHSLIPPLFGALRPDYHADLVLDLRGAGAVFSVSSMAWAGELAVDNYSNDVARMTDNVLRRFLNPDPFNCGGTS